MLEYKAIENIFRGEVEPEYLGFTEKAYIMGELASVFKKDLDSYENLFKKLLYLSLPKHNYGHIHSADVPLIIQKTQQIINANLFSDVRLPLNSPDFDRQLEKIIDKAGEYVYNKVFTIYMEEEDRVATIVKYTNMLMISYLSGLGVEDEKIKKLFKKTGIDSRKLFERN